MGTPVTPEGTGLKLCYCSAAWQSYPFIPIALRRTDCYSRIPAKVWQQEWVVHCEGVGSGLNALKYLAPYIFRVALSNNRLLKLENDRVTFRYRDTETGAEKRCSLGAHEFIHYCMVEKMSWLDASSLVLRFNFQLVRVLGRAASFNSD